MGRNVEQNSEIAKERKGKEGAQEREEGRREMRQGSQVPCMARKVDRRTGRQS